MECKSIEHGASFVESAARVPQPMAANAPTDLLRLFVAIVDAGSKARATDRIFFTPLALSLQMKRLEEATGTPA